MFQSWKTHQEVQNLDHPSGHHHHQRRGRKRDELRKELRLGGDYTSYDRKRRKKIFFFALPELLRQRQRESARKTGQLAINYLAASSVLARASFIELFQAKELELAHKVSLLDLSPDSQMSEHTRPTILTFSSLLSSANQS